MAKTSGRLSARIRRKKSIRKKLRGSADRPRLSIFRSGRHIYCQLIDDDSGRTLASASSQKVEFGEDATGCNREGARAVGVAIAEAAKAVSIESAVFDRNGYLYHGRVAALADGARGAGLRF
jgi:large subunit ribosomal protein L18